MNDALRKAVDRFLQSYPPGSKVHFADLLVAVRWMLPEHKFEDEDLARIVAEMDDSPRQDGIVVVEH